MGRFHFYKYILLYFIFSLKFPSPFLPPFYLHLFTVDRCVANSLNIFILNLVKAWSISGTKENTRARQVREDLPWSCFHHLRCINLWKHVLGMFSILRTKFETYITDLEKHRLKLEERKIQNKQKLNDLSKCSVVSWGILLHLRRVNYPSHVQALSWVCPVRSPQSWNSTHFHRKTLPLIRWPVDKPIYLCNVYRSLQHVRTYNIVHAILLPHPLPRYISVHV